MMRQSRFARGWSVSSVAMCSLGLSLGPGACAELSPDAPVFHEDSGSSHKDSSTHKDGSAGEKDGSAGDHDGGSTGSDAGSAGATPHLLITEISLNPDAGAFVEIYNPTSAAI